MLDVVMSNQFKKDLRTAQKRHYNIEALKSVVHKLENNEQLPPKNKDHSLVGDYVGFRECHIEPDWLLIYRIENDNLLLFLLRTGTHSDLF